MNQLDEAAYEALGILEALYADGDVPQCLRQIVADVLAKANKAEKELQQ